MAIPNKKSPFDDNALNIDNLTINTVNRLGQSIQDLVAEGQLTPSQYASLIKEVNGLISQGHVSVYDIDKNKGLLDQSFFTPEFLKQMAGTAPILSTVADGVVTNPKVAARAITPDKTTFFSGSGNLFDGNYRQGLLVRASYGTALVPTKNYDTYKGMTAVIPINAGKTYSVVANSNQSNVFRVGTHSADIVFNDYPFDSPVQLNRMIYAGDAEGSVTSTSVKTESNDKFLYVYVSNNGTNVELSVTENSIDKAYIPNLDKGEVKPEMTSFFSEGSNNLFNGVYYDGLLFYADRTDTGQTLYLRNSYDNVRGRTAIVPVKPSTTYAVKVHDTPTNDVFRIGLMDSYPEFIDSNNLSNIADDFVMEARTNDKEYTFATKSTTQYAMIYVSNDGSEPRLMVEEGDNYSPFESGYYIPSSFLQLPSSGTYGHAQSDGKFSFGGDFGKYYSEPALQDYYSDPILLSPEQFHNKFLTLVNTHSDIAKRVVLGRDDFTNPMYQYEIKPTEYYKGTYWNQNPGDEGTPVKLPKIVITAGIHGRERNVSYAAYYLFKAILENPNNIEELDILKTNFHIIVIPVASPSGFIDNTYENRSGMNINRDFPPYGEVTQGETKLIKQVLDENKDMDFFIDYHNMQPRHDLIGYSLTDNEFFKNMTLNMYRRVGRHWQQKESSMPQAINHRWGYTVASNEGTVGRYVNDVLGVPSTLIEIPLEYQWGSEGRHGPKNTQMGVDILMNTIFACIRSRQ